MEIKILKQVRLHEDLSKYVEKGANDEKLVTMVPGDIILKANDKYAERFKAFPNHIEIIKDVKK